MYLLTINERRKMKSETGRGGQWEATMCT